MPKFIVTKSVDAHANYSALVEADDATDAINVARDEEGALDWHPVCVNEYDDRVWGNIEPEEVADDYVMDERPEAWPVNLDKVLSALNEAEAFIQGFDGDEAQEEGSVEKLLALIASAKNTLEGR